MSYTAIARLVALVGAMSFAQFAAGAEPLNWYRCNTHTHTSAFAGSDANGTPEAVAAWYRAHGYQCLVITDHEFHTDVRSLNAAHAKEGEFLVIAGQEITQQLVDPTMPNGVRQLHVNGINTRELILPVGHPRAAAGMTPGKTYERNFAAIRAAGGLAQVNHPNLQWSVVPDDLAEVEGPFLLEVWNAFPTSHNLGGKNEHGAVARSTEEFWDALLTRGKVAWAVASDDAHEYERFDDREAPTPGKAWIVVGARALNATAIAEALTKGSFYASTGITLSDYAADGGGISIRIAPTKEWSPKTKATDRFVTRFIGANGRLLAEVLGSEPRYRFKGDERYVRASISDPDGRRAWTQPVFRDGRGE